MEQFATEEQQVEAIKDFWKQHGTSIILGAVVGFGGLFGWRYYSDAQIAQKEQASASYQTAVEAMEDNDDVTAVTQYIESHNGSGYDDLARFVVVQKEVASGNFDSAEQQLLALTTSSTDAQIKSVATLRLARVQIALGKLDAALKTAESVTLDSFAAQAAEIKGDIFVAQAKFDQAKLAYGEAIEKGGEQRLVQMKLDNIAVASGS